MVVMEQLSKNCKAIVLAFKRKYKNVSTRPSSVNDENSLTSHHGINDTLNPEPTSRSSADVFKNRSSPPICQDGPEKLTISMPQITRNKSLLGAMDYTREPFCFISRRC